VPLRAHIGEHGPPEQHRALDEVLELCDVITPGNLRDRCLRLRPSRIHDQCVDETQPFSDLGDETTYPRLTSDIGRKGIRRPAGITDRSRDVVCLRVIVKAVHGYREAVTSQSHGDRAAKATRTPGDESDLLGSPHQWSRSPHRAAETESTGRAHSGSAADSR
jgi:hypothetical protein